MTAVTRLLGVYDADGGLTGELRYVIGHLFGRAECALCDITHTPLWRKRAWDALLSTLPVAFDLRHRNELSPREQAALSGITLPVVAAELDDGTYRLICTHEELAKLNGDVARFGAVIARHLPPATTGELPT